MFTLIPNVLVLLSDSMVLISTLSRLLILLIRSVVTGTYSICVASLPLAMMVISISFLSPIGVVWFVVCSLLLLVLFHLLWFRLIHLLDGGHLSSIGIGVGLFGIGAGLCYRTWLLCFALVSFMDEFIDDLSICVGGRMGVGAGFGGGGGGGGVHSLVVLATL